MRLEEIVVDLYLKGIPKYKIVKRLNISNKKVTKILAERNINLKNRFGYSDKQLIYMYRRGMTSKEIRKKTLISEKNLMDIFRKHKIRSKSTAAWLKEYHTHHK